MEKKTGDEERVKDVLKIFLFFFRTVQTRKIINLLKNHDHKLSKSKTIYFRWVRKFLNDREIFLIVSFFLPVLSAFFLYPFFSSTLPWQYLTRVIFNFEHSN